MEELLENIGLTKSEIKVYLALLELGSSSKGPIVERSGVASSKIYELLEKLMQKGLVSHVIKGGVKYFEAAPPSRILDFVREKKENIEKQEKKLENIVPMLEARRSLKEIGSETQVFKGMKGARTASEDVTRSLKKGDEYYVISESEFSPSLERLVVSQYRKRAENGVKSKTLINELAKGTGEKLRKIPLTKIKYVQKGLFTPFAFVVYGNKTMISIPDENVYIQVKSEGLAKGLKAYIDYLWNQDVKVYKGFEDVMNKFESMIDNYKAGEEYYVLGATYGKEERRLMEWFTRYHRENRLKRGIRAKLLCIEKEYEKIMKEMQTAGDTKGKLGEVRCMPPDFSVPMQINLYKGNRALFFIFGKEMVCFEMESKVVYDNFKAYFDMLWNQDVRVYRGMKGLRAAQEDILYTLKSGDEYHVLSHSHFPPEFENFLINFYSRRAKKGIKCNVIMNELSKTTGEKMGKISMTPIKYVQKELFTPFAFVVYKDKTLVSIFPEKAFIQIKSENLAKGLRSYFDYLWNQDVKVYKGFENVMERYSSILETMKRGEEYHVLGATVGEWGEKLRKWFLSYDRKRAKRGVKSKHLTDPKQFNSVVRTVKVADPKLKTTEIRSLPAGLSSPMQINLYQGNRVLMLLFGKEMMCFDIESEVLYNSFRAYFDALWAMGKTNGPRGIRTLDTSVKSRVL